MQFLKLASAAALASSYLVAAAPLDGRQDNPLADLREQAMEALKEAEGSTVKRNGCSLANASIRKDWARLSGNERREYIRAVKCLQSAPSKSDPNFAPGARTRYDDFVAVHIDQTLTIHGTGNFLTWHRYFVQAYETALREECGYKGAQPYWNWFAHQDDLTKSPVFDGSDTSMSGNGAFFQNSGSTGGAGAIPLPPGQGGGCVESGPFKDMVVNMGPVSPTMDGLPVNPNGRMAANPRCLRRDLSNYTASTWLTYQNLLNITVGPSSGNIERFQNEYQGRFSDGFLGLHAAGHFAVNGDAGDLFSSPTDPTFFLHHAMVDLVYWLWQALHPRQAGTIGGTITINNNPPSRATRLDDPLNMGVLAQTLPIQDLLNTLSGEPLCYIYL